MQTMNDKGNNVRIMQINERMKSKTKFIVWGLGQKVYLVCKQLFTQISNEMNEKLIANSSSNYKTNAKKRQKKRKRKIERKIFIKEIERKMCICICQKSTLTNVFYNIK